VNSVLQMNDGNGVIVLSNSALILERSSLLGNKGQETAGVVLVRSSLRADQVSFSMQTGLRGCLIYASSSSSVSLAACNATQINCVENILDLASNSTLTISHSTFTDLVSFKQSIIRVEDGLLRADFLTVSAISTAQAFLSTLRTNVSIEFSEWRGLKGGVCQAEAGELFALEASEVSEVQTEATVLQCSAQKVQLMGVSVSNVTGSRGVRLQADRVHMQDCVFSRVHGQVQGAVWVESWELEVADSVFVHNRASDKNSVSGALMFAANSSVIRNCFFAFNMARSGAALHYRSTPPALFNTTFFANQALYGPALASFAGRLYLFNQSTIEVASGQTFTALLAVGMLDNRNQLVTTQDPSDAWLVGSGLSGRLLATAQNGVLRFSNFTVTGPPEQVVTLTVMHSVLEPIQLNIRIRSCLLGEIYFDQACVVCPSSTYSVDANYSSCNLCPSGGNCPGDGHLYPSAGYWRPFEAYNGLLECPNPDACAGHNNYLAQLGNCADLFENRLCQSCKAGTSRSQPDKCAKCPGTTTNIIIIAGMGCGVFVLIGVMTRSALRSAKKWTNKTGVLLKIFLNYVQMMVLISDTQLHWPKTLEQVFSSHQFAGNSGEQYLSLDCLLPRPFFDKTLGIALLPLALVGVNLVFWGICWVYLRLRRSSVRVHEKLVCSIIVSLFYFHLYITRTALSSFECITIPPGDTWLRAETANRCWVNLHLMYSLAAALPAVLVWSVGIPALALLLLVRHRKHLWRGRKQKMLGFLYQGYKKRYFFWEICIIYRKACLATLQVFMSGFSSSTQALTLVLLVFVTAQLQRAFAPFSYDVLNRAEHCSLLVVLATAYAGLYFSLSSLSDSTQIALMTIVILIHCCYVIYVAKILFRPSLRRLRINNGGLGPLPPLTRWCKNIYLGRLELQALKLTS